MSDATDQIGWAILELMGHRRLAGYLVGHLLHHADDRGDRTRRRGEPAPGAGAALGAAGASGGDGLGR